MQSPCQRTLGQSQLPWTGLSNEGRGAKGSIERLSGQLEPRNAWTNADARTHALKALDRGRTKFRWQATMMSCPISDRQISPPVTKIQKGATGAWNQAERVSERNGMAKVDGGRQEWVGQEGSRGGTNTARSVEREVDLIHVSPTYLMHSTLITFKIQGQVTAARISPHLKSNANVRVEVQFQK